MNITQKSTPNYTAGRGGNTIKKIVVHHMVGTIEGADKTFQDTVRQTSAHYGVARDGRIWQWVAESSTAWHAGNFTVNQQSIGIEHEDLAHDDFTETLYKTSAELIADICKRHNLPISATTVIPHRSVIATACPGALDLAKLISMAQAMTTGEPMFNEGDRVNINNYLYGRDVGRFKGAVGKSWKEAMYYGIFETVEFKTDALVNGGDVPAIENTFSSTDGETTVGRTWKELFYDYATKHPAASVTATELKPGVYRVK